MTYSAFSNPARRALLEKSSNICITSKHNHTSDNTMKTSAKHESISPFPSAIAGQKRSIDQVNADRDTILSPQNSFNRAHRQDEFYIYEERSQTSVGINEASFLRHPTGFSDVNPGFCQQESQESIGLSSLLNLSQASENNFCSSQRNAQKNTNQSCQSRSIVPTDPEKRKLFVQQKADLLRIRLQTAVKTMEKKRDLDRRVAEFEAHYEAQKQAWSRMVEHINSNQDMVARMASESSKNNASPLNPSATPEGSARGATMLSSPPRSTASGITDNEATPKQETNANSSHQPRGLLSPIQLPSPGSRQDPIVVDKNINCAVERMMAKHKRGEAIDGLLKLMETTTEYDALDEWTG